MRVEPLEFDGLRNDANGSPLPPCRSEEIKRRGCTSDASWGRPTVGVGLSRNWAIGPGSEWWGTWGGQEEPGCYRGCEPNQVPEPRPFPCGARFPGSESARDRRDGVRGLLRVSRAASLPGWAALAIPAGRRGVASPATAPTVTSSSSPRPSDGTEPTPWTSARSLGGVASRGSTADPLAIPPFFPPRSPRDRPILTAPPRQAEVAGEWKYRRWRSRAGRDGPLSRGIVEECDGWRKGDPPLMARGPPLARRPAFPAPVRAAHGAIFASRRRCCWLSFG